jgi:DNA-directed RNA polymerase subunit alpha
MCEHEVIGLGHHLLALRLILPEHLSVRVFNSLKRTGITTVGDVLDLLEKGETAVMSIRNFGEKSLDELRQKMREKGYMKDETSSAE